MAYVQRWYVSLFDDNGNEYQVKIYQDGYASTISELDAYGNGVQLRYPNATNVFSPIRGSELTVSVKNEDNFDYKEFYGGDYADFKAELVDITDSSTVIWTGFGQPENFSEPFVDYPYPSTLTFTCGLGELKNKEFTDTGALHTGYKHLMEVFRLCTNSINPLTVIESFNIYSSTMNNGAQFSPLTQMYIDSRIFREVNAGVEEGQSCYDVLKKVLTSLGCFIVQDRNKWYLVRSKEQLGNLYYRQFGPAVGTESSTAIGPNGNIDIEVTALDTADELTFINSSATMSIENRIRKVIYKLKLQHQLATSMIRNGGFSWFLGVNAATLPVYWTRSAGMTTADAKAIHVTDGLETSIITAVAQTAEQDIKFETETGGAIYLKMEDSGLSYNNGTGPDGSLQLANRDITDYIEIISEDIIVQSGDAFHWAAEYINQSDGPVTVPMRITLRDVASGTDYDYIGINPQSTTGGAFGFQYNVHSKQSNVISPGYDHLITFTGLAKLTVRLFKKHAMYNNGDFMGDFFFKKISFKYIYSDGSGPNLDRTITKEIDNRHDTYNLRATIGQGTKFTDTAAIRDSSLNLLVEWDRRNPTTGALVSEDLDLSDIVPCEVLDLKAEFNKRISGDLHENTAKLRPISRVVVPVPEGAGTTNVYCAVLGYTWNLQRSTFSFAMSEILETIQTPNSVDIFNGSLDAFAVPLNDKDSSTTTTVIGETSPTTTTTDSTTYPG